MYPCRVEEMLTIKLVEGEEVLKIKTTVTAKDGTITKFLGKFPGYKPTKEEEEISKLKAIYEDVIYDISDSDSDLESTARSGPRNSEMEDTGNNNKNNGNNNNNNGNNNNNNGNGGNNGCSYKGFQACGPKEYDKKGGAIALTRWIEKMENVLDNSGCSENQKVKYAASSFVNKALTWWNTQIQARGCEAVPHLVTPESARIKRYVAGLAPEIRGMLKATQPTTIHDPILRTGILTDEAISCGTLSKSNEKRKAVEETSKSGGSWRDKKKVKIGAGVMATAPPKNEFVNQYPKCTKCYTYHPEDGVCRLCFNCQRPGHFATVLFDSGADFSFISTEFAPLLNVKSSIVNHGYVIEVADGKMVEVDRIIRDYKLELGDSLFSINLIPLGHVSFDVILGMDWLSQNKAMIVCHEKVVEIP
ncbi:putative reverse transcriptase domain-containing protein, partial [Tanacetum coccineum]